MITLNFKSQIQDILQNPAGFHKKKKIEEYEIQAIRSAEPEQTNRYESQFYGKMSMA